MGVAVRGIDRDAALAGIGCQFDMPGPKASAWPLLPASTMAEVRSRFTSMRATGQVSAHDHGFMSRPLAMVSVKARSSSTCASSAGVDVGALAEQHEAESARARLAAAGHWHPSRHCEEQRRSNPAPLVASRQAGLLRFAAMTIKQLRARPWAMEAARFEKRVGQLLFHPASVRKSAPLNRNRIRLSASRMIL
jgi:hypothetical protein